MTATRRCERVGEVECLCTVTHADSYSERANAPADSGGRVAVTHLDDMSLGLHDPRAGPGGPRQCPARQRPVSCARPPGSGTRSAAQAHAVNLWRRRWSSRDDGRRAGGRGRRCPSRARDPARRRRSPTSLAGRSFGHIACKWDSSWLGWMAREEDGKWACLRRMFAGSDAPGRRGCYVNRSLLWR